MDKQIRKPLILLLGNYRPSLILARSFKSRGFDVMVSTYGCERLCQYSVAVSSMWSHSPLDHGPSVLADELKFLAIQRPELIAIIPIAEEYVRLIAEHELLFEGLPNIVSMDGQLIQKCLDKEFMLKLARSIDVPTAPFAYITGPAEMLKSENRIVEYPIIIRPKDSTKRINGNKAISIDNQDELVKCFNKHDLHNQELLVQQKFEGKRHNVYFAAVDGEATRLLHAVIERTDKIDGTGLAVEGRTLEANHKIVEQTKKLVTALNYSGIGCAQFLVNGETGNSSFLEINPRIAGNHALPEYAGLDLGWFNFERVVHKRINRKIVTAKGGLRYCWTSGDLMGARIAFRRKEIGFLSLLTWINKAIWTIVRSDLHMVFSVRDPYPAIRGLWNVVPRITRWPKPATVKLKDKTYSNKQRRQT